MKLRFTLDREDIGRSLRRKERKEWLVVGVLFFVMAAMLLVVGPLDTLFMGEPYAVEGELQDCYIDSRKVGRSRDSVLRVLVDGSRYTVWDSAIDMSKGEFRDAMQPHLGERVRMQCVDSPGYQRIVADLAVGDAQYIRLETALENRWANARGLLWAAVVSAAAGLISLVYACGIVRIRRKKKRRRRRKKTG